MKYKIQTAYDGALVDENLTEKQLEYRLKQLEEEHGPVFMISEMTMEEEILACPDLIEVMEFWRYYARISMDQGIEAHKLMQKHGWLDLMHELSKEDWDDMHRFSRESEIND